MKKQEKKIKVNLTKAETLEYLDKKLKKSTIEPLMFFSIKEWKNENKDITNKIIKIFKNHRVIIRSSAIGEDSSETSEAGNYESIQNVLTKPNEIKEAIKKVIKSYEKKGNFDEKNQILIQNQTIKVQTSGVIFTRIPENNSPYYIIDYEDSGKTDSITKGISSNVVKILRSTNELDIPEKWKKLLKSIKEIESVTHEDKLDIEFAITLDNIVIFQVRPLTIIDKSIEPFHDNKIFTEIKKNTTAYVKQNKKISGLIGNKVAFSDMSDWNPAEIIGSNPNELDYSLYDYLIMKDNWHLGRQNLGYSKLKNIPLMTRFGSKPFVNLRASFNSMIPENIPKTIKDKLIKYYFEKLYENPALHDKVEFEILFSCYDLSLKNRLKELKKSNFSNSEIQKIKKILLDFTNDIIQNFPKILIESKESMDILNIKSKITKKHDKNDHKSCVNSIKNLLEDCKNYGTLPFSRMARIAFISTIILKSLENKEKISSKVIDGIMNSIETPLTKIYEDLKLLSDNKISNEEFLNIYGHLRPGTYDITAKRYDQNHEFYEDIKYLKIRTSKNIIIPKNKINSILKKEGLIFENIDFIDFVRKSLELREFLKFEFTKNLSDALEIIAHLGNIFKLSREDMSNINIKTILKIQNHNYNEANKILRKEILKNQNNKSINDRIHLPPILFSKKDFIVITHYFSKPNFITQKKILADSIKLDNLHHVNELLNKIILIENADPGYDWIFSKNPSGLITKYGGVASHMSIRCAELKLPAAIGCGDILYEQLRKATKIMLDCKNQQIIVLEKEEEDQFSEEKKILKSLGYIR